MNPQSLKEAQDLVNVVDEVLVKEGSNPNLDIIFCPPFVFLENIIAMSNLSKSSQGFVVGAQNLAIENSGAYTGEISGQMLARLGVSSVIIGHSERRWKLNESDEVINKKLKSAISNNIIPIICFGERVRGDSSKEEISKQIQSTFQGVDFKDLKKMYVTYEPVWAISANSGAEVDNPKNASNSIDFIKNYIKDNFDTGSTQIDFIYGGSVNFDNVNGLILENNIDGVLVGGASVRKEDLSKLIDVMNRLTK